MIKQAWDYKSTVVKNLSNVGGGSNSDIKYYKVTMPTDNSVRNIFLIIIGVSSAFINCNQSGKHWIGPASLVVELDDANDYDILAIGFINKKLIYIYNEEITTFEGTLQERVDTFTSLPDTPKFNINDYLEPITEEEFYNIKPE